MLTEAEKKELEALKAKGDDLNDDEKAKLKELEAKATAQDEPTFSETYVKELRKENAKYRTAAKEIEKKLAAYDGVDPEKYKEMLDAQEEAKKKELEDAGEWDKLRDQLLDAHNEELGGKDKTIAEMQGQIDALTAEIKSTVLDNEIANAAAVAEAFNPSVVGMVIKTMTKVETLEDGKRVVRVLDAEGKDKINIKTGKPFTITDLIADMKQSQEYATLFKGGVPGAGSGGENFDGNSVKNPWKKGEHWNLTEQGRIFMQDKDLAKRLMAEAGVSI